MACLEYGGSAPCTSGVNCYDDQTGQPCGGTTQTNTGGNIPWSDPNYWSGWNNTVGSLGAALGSWSNLFTGNVQPTYYPAPHTQRNNTLLYVGMGLMFILLMAILFITLKKK